ncbi:hypothetical protein L2725_19280 [Shewanella corallii]|uniref:DUF2273 domain-containing protein n=1 Tax=Shewanella corallii TaxID=560080 RepID=A0ABT0NBS2_9GAMM|nr:hypothetical protein [Shewanella corallii]MCL2915888.1 hypothetical protein [Shewanella corallii]
MTDKKHRVGNGVGIGAVVGLAIGAGLGFMFDDLFYFMALWLVTGVFLGMLVDYVRLGKRK